VRISEVVLDFIQDMEGKVWLIGMKPIKMEDALSMQEISGVSSLILAKNFNSKNLDWRREKDS